MTATTLLWFLGGAITRSHAHAGFIAEGGQPRRSFSLLALASPLGAVLGGLVIGALIVYLGYGPAFLVMALLWLAIRRSSC